MSNIDWIDPRERVATLSTGKDNQSEIERLQGTLPPQLESGIVVLDVRAIEARGWTWSVGLIRTSGGYDAYVLWPDPAAMHGLGCEQAIRDTPQDALNAAYEQAQRELAK